MTRDSIYRTWVRALLGLILITASSLLINILTARVFTVEERGIYSAITSIAALAGGLSQFGIAQALVIAHRQGTQGEFRNSAVISAIATSIIAAMIGHLTLTLTSNTISISASIVAIASLAYSYHQFGSMLTQVQPSLKLHTIAKAAPNIILVALAFSLLALHNLTPTSLTISFSIAITVIITLASNALFKWLPASGKKTINAPKIFSLGIRYYAISAMGILLGNADKLYLISKVSGREFGLYSVAYGTSRLITSLMETASTTIFSRFAGEKGSTNLDSTLLAFRVSFYPLIIVVTVSAFFNEFILGLVFGEAYREAVSFFNILLFEAILGGGSWLLAQYFTAAGRPNLIVARQALTLAPMILAIFFLPGRNPLLEICLVLLAGSLARLTFSIILIIKLSGVSMRQILPRKSDYTGIAKRLLSR